MAEVTRLTVSILLESMITPSQSWDLGRGSDALPGRLVGVGVLVVVLVAQPTGRRLVHDDRGVRVHLQRRGRAERGDAAFAGLADRLGLALAEGQQHQVTGAHDGADALGDAMGGYLVDVVVEEAGVVRARLLDEGLDARARGQRGARLVEPDMAVGADAQDLHVDAACGLDRRIIGRTGAGDAFAVLQRAAVQRVAGHMHLGRVEAQRHGDGAVDGGVVRLRMIQRQTQVFVEGEALDLADVDVLGVDDLGQCLIGGQRAGTGGQAQHGVRLGLDEVGDATSVDLASFGFVLNNDDFRGIFYC